MSEKLYTTAEAAIKLNCNRTTIRNMIVRKQFPNAYKDQISEKEFVWRIPESDLVGKEVKMGRPKKN